MLGGPEPDAYAKIKGAELRAVASVLNRSSVYVMAAKGQKPAKRPQTAAEWASYFKGKRIGTGAYVSTPNSVHLRNVLRSYQQYYIILELACR